VHVPFAQRSGVSRAIRRAVLQETRRAETSEMRMPPSAVVLPHAAIGARAAAAAGVLETSGQRWNARGGAVVTRA